MNSVQASELQSRRYILMLPRGADPTTGGKLLLIQRASKQDIQNPDNTGLGRGDCQILSYTNGKKTIKQNSVVHNHFVGVRSLNFNLWRNLLQRGHGKMFSSFS